MGKDSLIKSTSKKKTSSAEKKDEEKSKVAAKKAGTTKKAAAKAKKSTKTAPEKAKKAAKPKTQKKTKAAPKKKTATKGKAAVATKSKTTTKKKTAAKPKSKTAAKTKTKTTAKPKAAPKAKKTAAKPEKKVSIKDLTFKKFDLWKPVKPLRVKPAEKPSAAHTPPPIFATSDKDELKRLKTLLLQKYDYNMLKKAAAEKAAAEKAAAEKAAAEKAAAEKAAAEKAAAEKAAAEKAAAEKAAAEPKPAISYEPPPDIPKPTEPADKMMTYGIGGFVLLVFLVVGASFLNAGNYYIKPVNGAIEIWQGKFAPKGTRLLISLPGQKATAPLKTEYAKKEVFPLIYAYYKDKATTLTEVKGMPDFDAEKSYLEKALYYSTSAEEKSAVTSRINSIDLMVLLLKADAAASRNTSESLTTALIHLKEAADLDLEEIQQKQVQRKTEQVKARLVKVETQEAKAKEAVKKAHEAQAKAKKADAKKKKADATPAKKADAKEKAAKSEKSH